jgi:hypothetical protein
MNEQRVQKYADMWTRDAIRYALIEVDSSQPSCCVVKDLETGGLVVIDDEDDVVAAVILRMRSAGVRVMTPEEAKPK